MNETEKQLRRTQIEMNRKSRQNAFKSTTTADKLTQTLNSDTDIDSIETLDEEKIIDYFLDIAYDSNDKTNNVNKVKVLDSTGGETSELSQNQLVPILLFNPKRPGIVQKDMIE
ncbi:unnamed protein product [Oppiella nova]|uniref:Uncharacterized protein n=1 Tax=Oppiella nova TaxID=334625 RepID=A0A7R9LSQ0_9ACAR|nr:unnamed protein product [Oppiella nova]CAG2165839.1 unnamed protein product [Oppiella nova]